MADVGELDVGHHEGLSGESSQNVRKNIALHLKTGSTKSRRGRKPGRPKKEERLPQLEAADADEEVQLPPMKGPPEPLHRNKKLTWDHKVNLVGRRHMDPHIHCCEHCEIPILIYGRVIPCKHVFCLDCAKKADKSCMRCGDPVQRIEQAALGTVFICTHGGAKHGVSGCRRTYLSNRDLQAHIQYRHAKDEARAASRTSSSASMVGGAVPGQRTDYVVTSQAPLAGVAMLSPSGQQQPGVVQQIPQQLQQAQQYVEGMHVLSQAQGYSGPPPVVVPQQQTYAQPPQQGTTIESYHTMSGVASQQQVLTGHPANLISIPMQQEQLAQQGGYDARVPPPQMAQAPGGVNYAQIQAGVVSQQQNRGGYVPVSFPSTMPPPHLNAPQQQPQQAAMVHMSRGGAVPPSNTHPGLNPNPRGGGGGPQIVTSGLPPRGAHTPVSSHSGMPPRGGPPPRFPSNQQTYSQQPGGHWQGQGGPPSMGHRPRTSSGAPPRY